MPLSDYSNLARTHARFLGFGFLMTFGSSAGQTYFIGVFGPEIRSSFDLSHTEWGSLYLIGTLASALVLPWSGHFIDRVDLRLYVATILIGLSLACVGIGLAHHVWALTVAIFLLRQFGQGLSGHAAITSMARYMDEHRGKAIAIASIGYSVGEAILPLLGVVAIATIGWRSGYLVAALTVLSLLIPVLWCLRGHRTRHQQHVDDIELRVQETGGAHGKTRREMLGETRFYLLLPAVLAPSYVSTALFFHHLTLAQTKGWSEVGVTGSYWVYAVVSVITSLVTGPLIDRFSASRVVPYYLVPLIAGLLVLSWATHPLWILLYMVLLGVNTGVYFTGINALWAELYGTRHLGAIKSMAGALMVFASALGPVSVGFLLDRGFSFEQVCFGFAAFCALSTTLLIAGLRRPGTH